MAVDSRDSADGFRLQRRINRVRLIISTPKILAGILSKQRISEAGKKSIEYVIVDEFDEFLLYEYDFSAGRTRFDDDFRELLNFLPIRIPMFS